MIYKLFNMSIIYDPDDLHGRVITYGQIKNIPSRNSFLNKKIYQKTNEKISNNEPLLFMPNDLHETHLQEMQYEKAKYCIVLFGVFLDGRRATIVLTGIKPYFEVIVPIGHNATDTSVKLNEQLICDKYSCPENYKIFKARQFKGYSKDKRYFIRFYFNKTNTRKEAITKMSNLGYETTSDDISSYYRVVCRNYLTTFSSWVYLNEYKIRTYNSLQGTVFAVDINDYKICTEDITTNPLLAKDNLLTCCWDIETYSSDGDVPKPENKDNKMFMIGITFQWHHATDQLLRVCLVDHPCDPRPNHITIICENEKKLIKAFGKLVYKLKPELFLGFNDSDYDWPWLIKRGKLYPRVLTFLAECFDSTIPWKNYDDKNIFKYNYKTEKIKLEADAYAEGSSLVFPGYINIDVRTIFRQLYPTAEKSNLNFYLSLNKLGGKKDMPYQEMFKVYEQMSKLVKNQKVVKKSVYDIVKILKKYISDPRCEDIIVKYMTTEFLFLKHKMAEIADYCVIDSQRCHELMRIRSVVMDRREVANLSYTSFYDALYRANGMKVRNLVIARGQLRGLRFSNITVSGDVEVGKYPGAYVFPPQKGLVTSKLTMEERIENGDKIIEYDEWLTIFEEEMTTFREIIMEYGACVSQKVMNEIITKYEKKNIVLKKCFIDFLLENMGRPITGLDFSSLYPSLIMTYNLSPEYITDDEKIAQQAEEDGYTLHTIKFTYNNRIIRGWSIRHDNNFDIDDPNCKFGIYPMILKDLFDKRSYMKKDLHKWEGIKEKMDALSKDEFNTEENKREYEQVCFNFSYIDSKQKALKVFMNTFYGEAGNKRSPFFVIQLAGAITTAGKKNIKMVEDRLTNEGCNVYYGDSVTGDTPLIMRNAETKMVYIKTIDDLVAESDWKSYSQFKSGEADRINKQQGICPLEIWTEGDWYEIKRVIRHKTNKKMFRVNTSTGCIDVTEDHSLFTPEREKIKPGELKIGTDLMHSFPTEFPEILEESKDKKYIQVNYNKCNTDQSEYVNCLNSITKEEAYIWGFFMADGSCEDYKCSSGRKFTWVINNKNIRYLNQAKDYLAICEPYLKFKILDTIESSGVYKLTADGYVHSIVEKYRKLFYDKRNYKLIPAKILNGSIEVRRSFYNGYYVGDSCKQLGQNNKQHRFCIKGKITAQCMYYLVKSLGHKYVNIMSYMYNPDIYWFSITNTKFQKNQIGVKKLTELPEITQDEFVYDIETSRGSFNGGVGALTVKNTDSCYSTMPEKHFKDIDKLYYTGQMSKLNYWTEQVNITFKVIADINNKVNKMLIDDNGTKFLKMAFEESLFPVAFLAKKKYYGIPHISQANFEPKELFIRGLEVKKRGVSDILKKVCMNIMWDSVSLKNSYTLLQLVKNKIDMIYSTEWDFMDFIMTDIFKPKKNNVKIQTFAMRMLEEGIKVKPFERFSYVIVKKNPFKYDERGRKKELLIGEKMEFADRAKSRGMHIDLDYYMKGSVNGQLARLITYSHMFHVEPINNDADELKKSDDKIYLNACNFINNYCAKYYTNYNSKGKIYQRIFRMSNTIVINKLKQSCGDKIVPIIGGAIDMDNLEEWIINKAEKEAIKSIKDHGKIYITKIIKGLDKKETAAKIKNLQTIYFADNGNLLQSREKTFRARKSVLERQLKDNLCGITKLLNYNASIVANISDKIKSTININNSFNESDIEVPEFDDIEETKNIDIDDLNRTAQIKVNNLIDDDDLHTSLNNLLCVYINLLSTFSFIHKTRFIVDYLKSYRDKTLGLINNKTFNTKKYIQDNVDNIINELQNKH